MKKLWILSAISLTALISCSTSLPAFPEVWQCQYNGNPRAFYCVNTETKDERIIELSSEEMLAAQCLSADDYVKAQEWVQAVKKLVDEKCEGKLNE